MSNRSALYTKQPSGSFAAILPDLGNHAFRGPRGRGLTNSEQNELAREKAVTEGYDQGHVDGFAKGQERGRKQAHNESRVLLTNLVNEEVARFADALQEKRDSVDEALTTWCRGAEEQMTDMAMDIVRKLLAAELKISRESALSICKEAVSEITHSTTARIRINPFDNALLGQHKAAIIAASASLREIDLVDDPSIYGGCVVETDGGVIDATIETGLQLIEGALEDAA